MPLLKIETNVGIGDEKAVVAKKLSELGAEMLGKPEDFVMVVIDDEKTVLFGGADAPAAVVSVDSIGLPEDRTTEFSEKLCGFVASEIGVPADRMFILFNGLERHMTGWNGKTF